MNAKELRIGNLVLKNDVVYCIGTGEDIGNCDFDKPIPLTEEWLKKFGFEFDIIHYKKGKYIVDCRFENMFSIEGKFGNDCASAASLIKIQYVHQLQNLYFALTGEELI